MGCRGLVPVAALLLAGAVVVTVRWISSPVRPGAPPAASLARVGAAETRNDSAAATLQRQVDPNLPQFVGETRSIAARVIDDTAADRFDRALLALGRRFLGAPARAHAVASGQDERLVLDLTGFDDLSYVEQLLALANSRRVKTKTEAVDRFSDHVRQLRYSGGRVDRCGRLRQPGLWGVFAERHGYLVDLSRFLPGARQRAEAAATAVAPPQTTLRRGPAQSHACPAATGPAVETVIRSYLPLQGAALVVPSLRSGDLFLVVMNRDADSGARLGMVDVSAGRLGALLAEPGRGVVQVPDLLALLRSRPGTLGLSFLRPVPNADGRPER